MDIYMYTCSRVGRLPLFVFIYFGGKRIFGNVHRSILLWECIEVKGGTERDWFVSCTDEKIK